MTEEVFPAIDEGVQARQKALENKFTEGVMNDPFPVGPYAMAEDPSSSNTLLPKREGSYKIRCSIMDEIGPVEDDSDVYEIQQIPGHRPIEGTDEMKSYSSEHDS
ncbi:hypothetical protein BGZ65_005592 [Modicella reniformis]|uniref:Uncharacterized protein n=1 Tax=Modicella reniformis TaxID=1440133 RepID=A0A9P6LYR3_9FUNG|nr:hypothetical protein BGZ65_005592 [Modicella reniformis]